MESYMRNELLAHTENERNAEIWMSHEHTQNSDEGAVTVCVLQLLCKQLKWPWHLWENEREVQLSS